MNDRSCDSIHGGDAGGGEEFRAESGCASRSATCAGTGTCGAFAGGGMGVGAGWVTHRPAVGRGLVVRVFIASTRGQCALGEDGSESAGDVLPVPDARGPSAGDA